MEKSKVARSRSSNIRTVTNRVQKHDKSRSNAEFRPIVKKKGVYVERKVTNVELSNEAGNLFTRKQQRKINRVQDKQNFLSTVLTILSKSTTGTQYPDIIEEKVPKIKRQGKNKKMEIVKHEEAKENNEKPKKYKSKTLNKNMDKDIIVLKNNKDGITNASSIFSEKSCDDSVGRISSIKFKTNVIDNVSFDKEITGIAKEVLEGKNYKRVTIEEPSTLVSKEIEKDEKGLYNLFVDLLETTISACDVNNLESLNYTKHKESALNIGLEIDESVAKKLRTISNSNVIENYDNEMTKSNLKYSVFETKDNPDELDFIGKDDQGEYRFKSNKLKSKSFNIDVKHKSLPKNKSTASNQKKSTRRDKKKNFLNILKQELSIEPTYVEQPRNFYQALKIMAKNKRRYATTARFDDNRDNKKECVFKQKKILTNTKRLKKERSTAEITKLERLKPKRNVNVKESNHSMLVYGFDYENTRNEPEKDNLFLTYTSSSDLVDSVIGVDSTTTLENCFDCT